MLIPYCNSSLKCKVHNTLNVDPFMIAVNPLMIAVLFILLVCVMPEYSLFAERSLGIHEFTNVDVDNV